MGWLLILAGVALATGVYLFDRPRPKPEPEVQEPARKKWVWEASYNPEVWFCEPCGKEYRVVAPPSVIPPNWMDYGRQHRLSSAGRGDVW